MVAAAPRCDLRGENYFLYRNKLNLGISAGDLVGHVGRPFESAVGAGFKIVISLQDFPGDALGAQDQAVGLCRAALLGVDVEWRHQVDFAGCPLGGAFDF